VPLSLTLDQHLLHCACAKHIITTFRNNNREIVNFWDECGAALPYMVTGEEYEFGQSPTFATGKERIWLPNGMAVVYPHLKKEGREYTKTTKKGNKIEIERLYGGKIAENCLGPDTKILTPYGWKCIVDITTDDMVWDGAAWVTHTGVIYKGIRGTMKYAGVDITPEHLILTDEGWKEARYGKEGSAERTFRRSHGSGFWGRNGYLVCGEQWATVPMEHKMSVWGGESSGLHPTTPRDKRMRPHLQGVGTAPEYPAWDEQPPGVCCMAQYERPLPAAVAPGIQKLWSKGHNCLRAVARVIRELLGRHGANVPERADPGAQGQPTRVQPRELHLGDIPRAGAQQAGECEYTYSAGGDAPLESSRSIGDKPDYFALPKERKLAIRADVRPPGLPQSPVFDIMNSGPRNRFTILGENGPFIVHNCIQAVARITITDAMRAMKSEGIRVVMMTHDEIVSCCPESEADYVYERMGQIMDITPEWCPGIALASEGGYARNYSK
jgi:hypothetical protein